MALSNYLTRLSCLFRRIYVLQGTLCNDDNDDDDYDDDDDNDD